MLSEPNSVSSPTVHITRPLYLAPEGPSASSLQQRIRRLQAQQSAEGAQDIASWRLQAAVQDITASAPTGADSRSEVRMHAAPQWNQRINRWLRPFFNLRWQIPLVFIALFVILLLILSGFIYGSVATLLYDNGLTALSQRVLASNGAILNRLMLMIIIATIVIIGIGSAAIFFFTNLLLSPLRHMRDAAQAIAFGDLKQRVRLPQSNDEVGELAVSFNEMIDQIEHAFEEQRASEGRTRRFVSDASHELRTPLTSLRGFTDVLMRGAKDDPETLQRSLKLMKNETERMSRLINDLLVLARMDEGNPLHIERVNMLDLGAEALEQTRILAVDGRDVSLQLATEDEQLQVLADVDRLKQVLLILFDNALKYGRPGAEGWIVLAVDKQDNTILMHVIDNGKGIAEEDLPHVFERFYRGRYSPVSADGTPIAGAGLGLSIALAIVYAHHGDLTARSEPGNTTFTVALPTAPIAIDPLF